MDTLGERLYGKAVYYVLEKDKSIRKTHDVEEWGRCITDIETKLVARTELEKDVVSTIFLGVDHGWESKRPILFETMIFSNDGRLDGYCRRYATYDEALQGHKEVSRAVKRGEELP